MENIPRSKLVLALASNSAIYDRAAQLVGSEHMDADGEHPTGPEHEATIAQRYRALLVAVLDVLDAD